MIIMQKIIKLLLLFVIYINKLDWFSIIFKI